MPSNSKAMARHLTTLNMLISFRDMNPRNKIARPNGVAFTPDRRTLYVADSQERKILAYDLDSEGNASHERVAIQGIEGSPDGLRVAANGNLYIACKGIAIYTPAGKLLKMFEFPETPANCAFGGSDLQREKGSLETARTAVYYLLNAS